MEMNKTNIPPQRRYFPRNHHLENARVRGKANLDGRRGRTPNVDICLSLASFV